MVIGILQVELTISHATSLKDKRRVVRSLKDRLRQRYNVAVAEVQEQETHRVAVLGIVTVSTSVSHAQSGLSRIVDRLRAGRDFVLADHHQEILTGR